MDGRMVDTKNDALFLLFSLSSLNQTGRWAAGSCPRSRYTLVPFSFL